MKFLFAALLCALANSAYAGPAPYIMSITGASDYQHSPWMIYGGLAGAADSNSCEAVSLSCRTAPLCVCNPKRVTTDGILTIDFDSRFSTGNVIMTSGYDRRPVSPVSFGPDKISVRWADLCAGGGQYNCEAIDRTKFFVIQAAFDDNGNGVIDTNETPVEMNVLLIRPDEFDAISGTMSSDGVNQFSILPGDGKVYLSDLETGHNFPRLDYGGRAGKLRVFISDTKLEDANVVNASRVVDFDINDQGAFTAPLVVEGLTNNVTYFFRIALVDQAANLVLHNPSYEWDQYSDCNRAPAVHCPYAATPGVVTPNRH